MTDDKALKQQDPKFNPVSYELTPADIILMKKMGALQSDLAAKTKEIEELKKHYKTVLNSRDKTTNNEILCLREQLKNALETDARRRKVLEERFYEIDRLKAENEELKEQLRLVIIKADQLFRKADFLEVNSKSHCEEIQHLKFELDVMKKAHSLADDEVIDLKRLVRWCYDLLTWRFRAANFWQELVLPCPEKEAVERIAKE